MGICKIQSSRGPTADLRLLDDTLNLIVFVGVADAVARGLFHRDLFNEEDSVRAILLLPVNDVTEVPSEISDKWFAVHFDQYLGIDSVNLYINSPGS